MSASLVLFAFCFLALLIPTICMGGTLPVLVKFFVTDFGARGDTIGRIYALNTLGAVLGSFVSGYFLMLYLGVSGTIYLAAGLNIAIGLVALGFRVTAFPAGSAPPGPPPVRPVSAADKLVIAAVFVSGFAAMVYEVTWTRLFALILGSSVYAFSAMLTAFLGGIVFGSYGFSERLGQRKATLALFGLVECGIAVFCLLLIPAFDQIIYWSYLIHSKFSDSFWLLQLLKFTLCFYTIIIPTALFGVTFPLAAALFLQERTRIGGDTGAIYFANTVGSAGGSFLRSTTTGTKPARPAMSATCGSTVKPTLPPGRT
jgi:spermidine synthase